MERLGRLLQSVRVPLMAALVVIGGLYIDRPPLWPGFAVAAFGEMIQIWAASQLHKDRTLADSGPYAHVRNPMYIGRFFVLLGFLLLLHNLYVVGAYVVLYAVYAQNRVAREEARLTEVFGKSYAAYCSEVRRWLPRVTPYRGTSGRRLSWSRIVANHEYRNAAALAAVCLLVALRVHFYQGLQGLDFISRLAGR